MSSMTNMVWVEFYKHWTYHDLLNEIESCYKFQQSIMSDVGLRHIAPETGANMLRQSQQRVSDINEVIRDKVKKGEDK